MKPSQVTVNKPAEKKVKLVCFVVDAVINFNYTKQISCEEFEITLVEDIVFFQDRKTKIQYAVPMSNVRTIIFQ